MSKKKPEGPHDPPHDHEEPVTWPEPELRDSEMFPGMKSFWPAESGHYGTRTGRLDKRT